MLLVRNKTQEDVIGLKYILKNNSFIGELIISSDENWDT